MTTREQLKDADSDEMIAELNARGDMPQFESDINDFSEAELYSALGITPDDDIDWPAFYQLFHIGREEEAVSKFKRLIEQRTGRIIV